MPDNSEPKAKRNPGWFKPGVSGNPRGGNKKKRNAGAEDILSRPVSLKFAGETVETDPRTAIIMSLGARGMAKKKDVSALSEFLFQAKRIGEEIGLPRILGTIRWMVRPRTCDLSLHHLEIVYEKNGKAWLAPWVLKEAVRRNPSLDLSGFDREALLAVMEDKAAAEKLLASYGLAQGPYRQH